MPKKSKYHFLTLVSHSTGLSIVTLPGQSIGLRTIDGGVLVKDATTKSRAVSRIKKLSVEGDILFTTTLGLKYGYYTAKDCYRLKDCPVYYIDAKEEYEKLKKQYDTSGKNPHIPQ